MHYRWTILLLLVWSAVTHSVAAQVTHDTTQTTLNYYTLNRQNGLSDDCVWQLEQLDDGRMVVVMPHTVDIYDGVQCSTIALDSSGWLTLPAYHGATHVYSDGKARLWLKQYGRMCALDLRTLQQVPLDDDGAEDFYADAGGHVWLLHDQLLTDTTSGMTITLPDTAGALQDVVWMEGTTYTFHDTGRLVAYDSDGTMLYQADAYGPEEAQRYTGTSLVVGGADDYLYQIRTGTGGSVLLAYHRPSHQWHTLLTSDNIMHTLTQTAGGLLYLTTSDGYLRIDPTTGQTNRYSALHLPDGTVLSTGINTVCLDREGGIWLGTYGHGVLYTSPWCGLFDTRPIDAEVYPILTSVNLHGAPIRMGAEYDGRVLLDVAPPYADRLTFGHSQNSLAFQFATMNYMRPRSTCFRYRLTPIDTDWHTVTADSAGGMVNDQGLFYLPLVDLAPGEYVLEVMASTHAERFDPKSLHRIGFTIEQPWWRTIAALVGYLLMAAGGVVQAWRRRQSSDKTITTDDAPVPALSPQEEEWLARTTKLVTDHMADPDYGVEQLATDLCMERTGLYKKLTALGQPSPVNYIRSIRLRKAAEMLLSGPHSIAEVALQTGFSSASYFSKCFQREYGCRPLEYIKRRGI
ncbi:MAG: helix-turn-helix domain-containing protein [Bacteroidales bacterium]|nr:helix-turn-helix domain-containing protein [Bacteroidales bacterium]